MKIRSLSSWVVFGLFISLLLSCGGKGAVVAKVKGLKIYQKDIDTMFVDIKDEKVRADRIKERLKAILDEQVLFNKAAHEGFLKTDTNAAILKNIEMIETANYFDYEIVQKNWGFMLSEVEKAYKADMESYKANKPSVQDTASPTEMEKKALDAYAKNPYQSLDAVRTQVLTKMLLAKPENKAILDSLAKAVGERGDSSHIFQKRDEIVRLHVGGLTERIVESLKSERKVEFPAWEPVVSEDEIKTEWEKTKDQYKKKPDLVVEHIEVSDETVAKKIHGELSSDAKADFGKPQKKYSKNKATVSQEITIRPDEPLTAIKGETAFLYDQISSLSVGQVSVPMPVQISPTSGAYHIFKLVRKGTEEFLPFDDCKDNVRSSLVARKQSEIPNSAVVALLDGGKKKITAGELFTLLYKNNPMVVERYKTGEGRKRLLEDYYVKFLLLYEYAVAKGLKSDPVLKERVALQQKRFVIADYKQQYHDVYYGLNPKVVKKYYDNNKDVFMSDGGKVVRPFDAVKSECVDRVLVDSLAVRKYYEFNREDFSSPAGDIKPFDEVSSSVRNVVLSKVKNEALEAAMRANRRQFGLKIYRSEYDFASYDSPEVLFEKAKKHHEERQYSEAMKIYQNLRFIKPDFNGHPEICMAMAQIYTEQNQFNKAVQEYKRYMRLYGDKGDSYKAQFMIGFVYSENIKDTTRAIAAYQAVKDNYPSCDLADDADYMIRSIRSGEDILMNLQDDSSSAF